MGPVLEVIDVAAARRWAVSALAGLGRAREEIDALNVFPVPDGDTGTNLYLTLEAACSAVVAVPGEPDLRAVAETFARGALFGARGSSGVIMAQMLRGWADVLGECGRMDGDAVREAFTRADSQAWSAVSEPMEGTILSVSRAAVGGAVTAGPGLGDVVTAALARARGRSCPQQLEPLRRRGGGRWQAQAEWCCWKRWPASSRPAVADDHPDGLPTPGVAAGRPVRCVAPTAAPPR